MGKLTGKSKSLTSEYKPKSQITKGHKQKVKELEKSVKQALAQGLDRSQSCPDSDITSENIQHSQADDGLGTLFLEYLKQQGCSPRFSVTFGSTPKDGVITFKTGEVSQAFVQQSKKVSLAFKADVKVADKGKNIASTQMGVSIMIKKTGKAPTMLVIQGNELSYGVSGETDFKIDVDGKQTHIHSTDNIQAGQDKTPVRLETLTRRDAETTPFRAEVAACAAASGIDLDLPSVLNVSPHGVAKSSHYNTAVLHSEEPALIHNPNLSDILEKLKGFLLINPEVEITVQSFVLTEYTDRTNCDQCALVNIIGSNEPDTLKSSAIAGIKCFYDFASQPGSRLNIVTNPRLYGDVYAASLFQGKFHDRVQRLWQASNPEKTVHRNHNMWEPAAVAAAAAAAAPVSPMDTKLD